MFVPISETPDILVPSWVCFLVISGPYCKFIFALSISTTFMIFTQEMFCFLNYKILLSDELHVNIHQFYFHGQPKLYEHPCLPDPYKCYNYSSIELFLMFQ